MKLIHKVMALKGLHRKKGRRENNNTYQKNQIKQKLMILLVKHKTDVESSQEFIIT